MAMFFSQRRGAVVRVGGQGTNNTPSPFAVRMLGAPLGDVDSAAIITQAMVTGAGNVHIQHAADESIYAYIFGDRIGALRIGGIAFANRCGFAESGIDTIMDIYRDFRAGARGHTVMVSIGQNVTRGLLVGLSINIADGERELAEWGFEFVGLAPLGPIT